MVTEQLLEWALAIVGGGGIGSVITYLVNLKSNKKKNDAEAESAELSNECKKHELQQDQYDYLQKTCDKYIKDYHDLESDFREQIGNLRTQMDNILKEKSQTISDKCTEIAELKAKVTYLKGIRCYNFTCQHRVKDNPDKTLD